MTIRHQKQHNGNVHENARTPARFTALLHHITLERLWKVFTELKRDAAPGADGLTWWQYEQDLRANLEDLHGRVQSGKYRAKGSRRI